jgi:hypothetical protein
MCTKPTENHNKLKNQSKSLHPRVTQTITHDQGDKVVMLNELDKNYQSKKPKKQKNSSCIFLGKPFKPTQGKQVYTR